MKKTKVMASVMNETDMKQLARIVARNYVAPYLETAHPNANGIYEVSMSLLSDPICRVAIRDAIVECLGRPCQVCDYGLLIGKSNNSIGDVLRERASTVQYTRLDNYGKMCDLILAPDGFLRKELEIAIDHNKPYLSFAKLQRASIVQGVCWDAEFYSFLASRLRADGLFVMDTRDTLIISWNCPVD